MVRDVEDSNDSVLAPSRDHIRAAWAPIAAVDGIRVAKSPLHFAGLTEDDQAVSS